MSNERENESKRAKRLKHERGEYFFFRRDRKSEVEGGKGGKNSRRIRREMLKKDGGTGSKENEGLRSNGWGGGEWRAEGGGTLMEGRREEMR